MRERCPVEKGAVAPNELLSKDAYALFSPSLPLSLSLSLLEPKYNDQSSAIPFFDRFTRHVGHARGIATGCVGTPCIHLNDAESEGTSVTDDRFTLVLLTLAKG